MERRAIMPAGLALLATALACNLPAMSGDTPAPTITATVETATETPPEPTVEPTETRPPPPPPPPPPEPTEEPWLLRDDFEDPDSGWEIGNYTNGSVGYGSGYYYVTSTRAPKMMWGVASRTFDDIVIETRATLLSTSDNDYHVYGIGCRIQSDADGYHFRISGDGFFSIVKVIDGESTPLVGWTSSDAINQGAATNRITAVCNGSRLELIVNGTTLATASDSTFTSGDIALHAITFEDTPAEVHFDYVLVTEPPEGTTSTEGSWPLQDDFANPDSGWDVGNYPAGSIGYGSGYYYVVAKQNGVLVGGTVDRVFTDTIIETDLTLIDCPAPGSAYGVGCRVQRNGDGYYMRINDDGFYSMARVVDGEFFYLAEWAMHRAVRDGLATNEITAICDGSHLEMIVNGTTIATASDSTFTSGHILLTAATYSDSPVEVHFHSVLITQP